jgi:hypothetical protein
MAGEVEDNQKETQFEKRLERKQTAKSIVKALHLWRHALGNEQERNRAGEQLPDSGKHVKGNCPVYLEQAQPGRHSVEQAGTPR